jgi:hypothetical protein
MAQAAFSVNRVRIIDKGEYLVIEGQKQCKHGHVIDHVVITVPSDIKELFRQLEEDGGQEAQDPQEKTANAPNSTAVANRLEEYFRDN